MERSLGQGVVDPASGRQPRFAIVRGTRDLGRHFAAGWRALPTGSFARWLVTIVIGFVACAGLTWLLTAIASRWAPNGLHAWDERTTRWIESNGPMSFPDAILAESPGNLSYLIPLTLLCAVLAARARRPMLAISFIVSYTLARPLVILGWHLWDRPRPDFIAAGVATPSLHSFPSGHAALAIAVWGLLAYLWAASSRSWFERAIACVALLAWVAMLSVARVRLGAHWPSDVLAGGIIGVAWLTVVVLALRRADGRLPIAPAPFPK